MFLLGLWTIRRHLARAALPSPQFLETPGPGDEYDERTAKLTVRVRLHRSPSAMRLHQPRRFLLACLGLVLTTALLRADAPPDPARLVPEQADLCLEVRQPRQLVEGALTLDLVNQLRAVVQVREFLDSTTYRRFSQIVGYFEKQLGTAWPEMLDRLAGGGVVLAAKQGENPGLALIVIQGKDAELTKKFAHLGLDVLEQELARQD